MNRRTQGPTGHGSPPTPSSDCARRRPGSHWRLHYDNSTPRLSVSLVPCNDRLAVFCAAKLYYRSGAQGPSEDAAAFLLGAWVRGDQCAQTGERLGTDRSAVESSSTHDARHRERTKARSSGRQSVRRPARPPSRSQAGVSPCVHSCLPAGRMAEGRGTPRRKARHAIGRRPSRTRPHMSPVCHARQGATAHAPSRGPFLKRRGRSSVPHAASAAVLPANHLLAPVVVAVARRGVAARRAHLRLDVEGCAAAAADSQCASSGSASSALAWCAAACQLRQSASGSGRQRTGTGEAGRLCGQTSHAQRQGLRPRVLTTELSLRVTEK